MRRSRKRRKWSRSWGTGRFDCTATERTFFAGSPFQSGILADMTLVQATRLAAAGCLLELSFSLAENANSLIRGGTVSLSTAGAAVLAYFPLVSFCLFLLALYYEFAKRSSFLSVRVCALLAAFGAVSTIALTIFGLLTHRIYFLNALQYLHGFGLVVTLRICWAVFFGMFAAGARPPGSAAMRAVAVVTAVLQGLAGLWDGYFLLRRVVGLWPVEFGRAYLALGDALRKLNQAGPTIENYGKGIAISQSLLAADPNKRSEERRVGKECRSRRSP